MKHLLALFILLLTVTSAQAQTEKITAVTKLPGEETLSIRERAERDFLMPVRRKKVVAETPKTIGEEVKAVAEDVTAAPETDGGATTAHFTEAADEVRAEEAAPAREAHVARTHSVRHTAKHSSTRSHKASKAKSSKSHSAKKSSHKAKSKAKSSKNSKKSSKKSSSHKASKKSSSHKSSHKKKHRR